jgi:hypothetical protein
VPLFKLRESHEIRNNLKAGKYSFIWRGLEARSSPTGRVLYKTRFLGFFVEIAAFFGDVSPEIISNLRFLVSNLEFLARSRILGQFQD